MKKQFRLTQEGIDELKAELQSLIAERPEIADSIRTAREHGDLSENSEYQVARQNQDRNEGRISEIEHILANVELIKTPRAGSKVVLGATVHLKSDDGTEKKFQVVGTIEADPLNGKISDESPIGQALLGKKEGENVEITLPAETRTYVITSVS